MLNLNLIQIPWADRWIGGFCPLGAMEGLPVRGPDYAAHPPLAQVLRLPAPGQNRASHEEALAAWSAWCGEGEIALVCSLDRAWRLLLCAAGVGEGEAVGVPANGSYALVEAIKQYGATPHFLALAPDLGLAEGGPALRVRWAQSLGGLPTYGSPWHDYSDSLPSPEPLPEGLAVAVYGLHLHTDPRRAGALVVFGDQDLARAFKSRLLASDLPDPRSALAQLGRVRQFAPRQSANLQEVWRGLSEAAALPMFPLSSQGPLAQGVGLRIPAESDIATFYSYAKQENTPLLWLPEARPLHYAALRAPGRHAASGAHLAQHVLIPVGPDYTEEEIKHAVLGPVKTSEYLGVRWRTQSQKAADYAKLLDEMYGPHHDAYRPLFDLGEAV